MFFSRLLLHGSAVLCFGIFLICPVFEKEAEELAALWEQERGKETAEIFVPRELSVTYELTRPTQTVESILWTVWSYMGGAHGQLSLVAHNYEVETGYPVLLEDLFLDPDDMLQAGTEPVESNFQIFVLLSDGLRIHFPPYQVAPWAMGPQSVDITLKELNMAKPDMKFWTPITN